MNNQPLDTLWLARAIYDLGGVTFGDYTLGGSTVNSPVYINPRALISNPEALRVAARLLGEEVALAQSLRRAHAQQYDVVAGVPTGGLLLATAFALETNTPLIYARLRPEGTGQRGRIRSGLDGHFDLTVIIRPHWQEEVWHCLFLYLVVLAVFGQANNFPCLRVPLVVELDLAPNGVLVRP